jgi:hypothetical protein
MVDDVPEFFGEIDRRRQRQHETYGVERDGMRAGMRRFRRRFGQRAAVGFDRVLKEIAMADRLHHEEHAVERQRQDRDGDRLRRRQDRSGRHGEIRQDEREHRERDHDRQECASAGQIVGLLAMPQSAEQEAQADRAVEHDHHHREHRVAGDRRAAGAGAMAVTMKATSMMVTDMVRISVP